MRSNLKFINIYIIFIFYYYIINKLNKNVILLIFKIKIIKNYKFLIFLNLKLILLKTIMIKISNQ